jgi:predicted transcriptional regulator
MRQAMSNPKRSTDRGSLRTSRSPAAPPPTPPSWTFLTNHAHVLLCIVEDPKARIRDLSERVGITDRAVQKIITELEESGYLSHVHAGRRNVYRVVTSLPLRHAVENHRTVGALLALVGSTGAKR